MRVLITQGTLHRLSGSEVVTFELAEHFSREGAEVSVASHGFNSMWRERLGELPAVELFGVSQDALRERFEDAPPDVAWVHHSVIPPWLLDATAGVTVFHHMSSFHPAEFPISGRIEFAIADTIAFPSREALDFHASSPQFGRSTAPRLEVFGNPAPDRFYIAEPAASSSLRSVLIVSNHVPDEIRAAVTLLEQRGVSVRVFGENQAAGDAWTPVTEQDVGEANAIISIGKTVQYALVGGTPVYCYDYFGGPGWLSESNFDRARHFNFSGRGFSQKTAEQIADEILGGYETASVHAHDLHAAWASEFLYSTAVPRILERGGGTRLPPPDPADLADFLAAQNALALYMAGHADFGERMRHLELHLAERDARLSLLQETIEERDARVRTLQALVDQHDGLDLRGTIKDYVARRSARRGSGDIDARGRLG